uniref:Uncharacterized protein n=1 Tax=Rhizophora mucronata TaxID=61149 RepID=A0A2P2Q8Q9_RHIMU
MSVYVHHIRETYTSSKNVFLSIYTFVICSTILIMNLPG